MDTDWFLITSINFIILLCSVQITLMQIEEFGKELRQFYEKFKLEGPGSVGRDLDKGVELMKEYVKEVERFETDRQELANAEKLFDLPITMYPDLLQIQKEMRGLEQIYQLYEDQKACSAASCSSSLFELS